MRWFFILSVVLHTLLFIGMALYLRPGAGVRNSPFAESLPTSTTHPAMGLLPTLEVTRPESAPRERVEFEIVETPVRPTNKSVVAKPRPADPKPASGFRLKQVDGYQITIAPSFTGAPTEKDVKPDPQTARERKIPATPDVPPSPTDAPLPPGFVPAAQTQDEQ